jgi:mevalonate kinase
VHGNIALATVIDKRTSAHFSCCSDDEDEPMVLLDLEEVPGFKSCSWKLATLQALVKRCEAEEAKAAAATQTTADENSSSSSSTLSLDDPDSALLDRRKAIIKEEKLADNPTAIVFLLYYTGLFRARRALRCRVSSELPIGAGLGSSAAYSSTLACGFVHLQQAFTESCSVATAACAAKSTKNATSTTSTTTTDGKSASSPSTSTSVPPVLPNDEQKKRVNKWAYQGERAIHGNPSGVDNTCCVFGGVIVYQKKQEMQVLRELPPLRILVTNTKQSRNTKNLVAGVGKLIDTHSRIFMPVLEAIHNVSGTCVEYISKFVERKKQKPLETEQQQRRFVTKMAQLFDINQNLLNTIGVSHVQIDKVVKHGKAYNLASKLTGAGGGGCVITLIPSSIAADDLAKFKAALVEEKSEQTSNGGASSSFEHFECFEATIGQSGAYVVLDDDKPSGKSESKQQ